MTALRFWSAAAAFLLAAACSDTGPVGFEPVRSVEIAPDGASLVVSEEKAFTVTVRGVDGGPLEGRTVAWSSSDARIARVSANGRVTAVAPGTARITATSDQQADTVSVAVRAAPRPVATVEIQPTGEIALVVGGSARLQAIAKAADGTPLDSVGVTWASADPAVAGVSGAGVVTAVATGVAVVTAASEGKVGRATVRVTDAPRPVAAIEITAGSSLTVDLGAARQLAAITRAADGTEITGRVVTWSSDAEDVASVTGGGVLQAHRVGSAVVTASSEGNEARLNVTVRSGIVSIDVSPTHGTVAVGGVLQLTAQPRGASGMPIDRPVTWTSSDESIAAVVATGHMTVRVAGRGSGLARITATSDGRSRTVDVWVYRQTQYALVRVGESALPTPVYTRTETDPEGAIRTERWEATEGYFRLTDFDRFEQAVSVWVHRTGVPPTQHTIAHGGTFERDLLAGVIRFYPEGRRAAFIGRFLPDGSLSVTRQLEPQMSVLTFVHRAP